uniref:FAST kinase domain-containing protein 5, mitochondrial n=1 Tax=Podarcis muralis TaxID=64176 RepID=UPI0010A09F8E|nr:FAST kinase domain-containing protein 5, mitochondrial [Podarcis muralis]
MATRIICRRFAGQPCRAAAFSTTSKAGGKTVFFRKAEEGGQPTKEAGEGSKPATMLRLWKPAEYRVSFNPSAYPGTKAISHEEASRSLEEGPLESDCPRISAKPLQNACNVTCSRKLSSTQNTLLDLEGNHTRPIRPSLEQPTKLDPVKDNGEAADVEAYDPKEDIRLFQKQRPEYRSLCYNRDEFPQPISVEERDRILQKISVLKSSLKPRAIAEYFFKLSCLPVEQQVSMKSNPRFSVLCRYGIEKVQLFNISELMIVLEAFVCIAIPPSHSMLNVYEAECCRQVWDMTLDQQLMVADLWRCLGRSVPQYLESMLSCVNVRWKELSLPHLVQLVYIIGEGRKAPEELMKKLDFLVLKHLDSLNLEEVGAICLGFFKSHNSLSEHTMRKIGDKVSARMSDMSSFALVNVLKMYRYTHVIHLDFMNQLGNVVPPMIPTIGIQGVMHITLACSALHYLDERMMNAVAASLPSRVSYCRSKDIAKFLWSFGCLNYEPPNAEELYASLEEEMRAKMHEIQKFPEHFLTFLLALAFAERFPNDLIDYALGPEFAELISKSKFDLSKDLFTLDGTVEIECPSYTGHRLEPRLRQEVAEMLWNVAKKDILTKPESTEALSLLGEMLGGPQYVKSHMLLPHTRSVDLEIRFDSDRKPLPFNSQAVVKLELNESGVSLTDDLMSQLLNSRPSSQSPVNNTESKIETSTPSRAAALPQDPPPPTWDHFTFSDGVPLTGAILNALTKPKASSCEAPAPRSNELQGQDVKLAVQVSGKNHYCYSTKRLLGFHSLKRRQLRQMGYVVVELPFWEWLPLLRRSRSEKLSYLHHKVFGALDEIGSQ